MPFFGGVGGASVTYEMEIPVGAINGVNDEFVFTSPPAQVFYQGLLQNGADYVLDGSTATFTIAPVSGTVVGLVGS